MIREKLISCNPVGWMAKIFVCLLFVLSAKVVAGQKNLLESEYSYRRYTTQDGLPSMLMQAVFKDSKGFLWQGTLTGGSSFDGFNFTTFSMEKFPFIQRIEETDGQIRFLYKSDIFYPEKDILIHLSDTLALHTYNSYSLPANHYIFDNMTGKKYFVKTRNDTISEVIDIPQLQSLQNCKVYLDVLQNVLYIPDNAAKKVHLYHFHNNTSQTIENIIIETFFNHSHLGLLGFGNAGIYKIKDNKAELYIPFTFEMQNKIVKEAQNGELFIKDFYNIYRMRNDKVEHLYRNSSFAIWDMVLDNDDNLWIGTSKGFYNFFHFDFKNYSITGHAIRSVTQDNNKTLWFAGANEDIFMLADGHFKQVDYTSNKNISTTSFYTTFSHNNVTYFLIKGGILIHSNNRFHWADVPVNHYYKNMSVYGDHLLAVSSDVLFEITSDGKIVRTYNLFESNQSGYDVAVDKNNRIFVGGEQGILKIENEEIRLLKNEHTAFSDIVCVDNQNHVFSAAKQYLNLVDGDTIKTIHGFGNDYIQGLLPFDKDNMIITTLKGFYIFNTKNYFEKNEIQLLFYNQNNGLMAIEPTFGRIFQDKDGMVWMITSENVVSFDVQKLIRQASKPKLVVRDFAVSKDNVQWEYTENFANTVFSHRDKNFKISFIGLNYSAVENVRYHYRLLGFQNDWSEPSKSREVTFNNLPPGDYTFEIYADAGTDESRCEAQSFAFAIQPAFRQTAGFMVVCIVSLIITVAGVTLFIQRRRNKALLEKLRAEKELNELRISSIRLKAIPHFNANVLSAIEYYIANRTKEEAMRILGIYSDFTYKTLSEVDKAARPLSEELAYVKMYLDLEKIRFFEKFDFQIEVEKGVNENVELPNMILHTYCENAVKHGLMPLKKGGLLTIHVSQHNRMVCVSVEDNGVGREYAARNPHLHSSKQGLYILNRQIEIYNRFNREKINRQVKDLFTDGHPNGTVFTIEIPLEYKYIS